MHTRKVKAPDAFEIRAKAGEILAVRGNRLMLIEACVVLLITVMLYFVLYTSFGIVYEAVFADAEPWMSVLWSALYGLILFLLTLFFTVPLFLGLLRMAWDMENGNETTLPRLFSSFESRKLYGRSLRLSFGAVWRVGLIAVTVALTYEVTRYFFAGSLFAGVLCGLAVLLEIFIGILLCLRRFPTLAVAMYEQTPLSQARRIARELTRLCPSGGVLFFLSFVPHILLGIATFGIFLIWEVLPRMCVSYFLYCRKMNEMIIRSEEYKKHE